MSGSSGKIIILSSGPLPPVGLDSGAYVSMAPAEAPSLVALLSARPEVTDIVLVGNVPWSPAHILAAARQLHGRGKAYLVGNAAPELRKELPLISRLEALKQLPGAMAAARKEDAEKSRENPEAGAPASDPPGPERPEQEAGLRRPIQPLFIPDDVVYYFAVAGSQARIGCTTQAIGLWHYCKRLGFDPAITVSPGRGEEMARMMNGREIPGGWDIDGIPFIRDAARAYDCYIRDLGALGSCDRDAFLGADWSLLVAGVKPWELAATAEAAALLRSRAYASVLLSYAIEADRRELEKLFDGRGVAVAPWLPRPWTPPAGALASYDRLLRPVLARYLRQRTYRRERTF